MRLLRFLRSPQALVALGLALGPACGDGTSASGEARGLVVTNPYEGRPFFHDFGTIASGKTVEHVFLLENTDPEPITFLSTQGACACSNIAAIRYRTAGGDLVEANMSADSGLLTLPVGVTAEVLARVDTRKIHPPNRDKLAIVRVRTDSKQTPFLTFELHIKPEKLFSVTPAVVQLGDVPTSHGGAGTVRVLRGKSEWSASVVAVESQGQRVRADLEESFFNGEPIWVVTVTLPENEPLGPLRDRFTLGTTDATGETPGLPIEVDVRGDVVDDVRIYPINMTFGAIQQGTSGRIDAEVRALVPGARVKILGIDVEGPAAQHVRVEATALAEDGVGRSPVWRLVLTTDDQLPVGRFEGTLRVRLDDSQYPELSAPFEGFVR